MGVRVDTVAKRPLSSVQRTLEQKIRDRSANLGVIGLGNVGLRFEPQKWLSRDFGLLA